MMRSQFGNFRRSLRAPAVAACVAVGVFAVGVQVGASATASAPSVRAPAARASAQPVVCVLPAVEDGTDQPAQAGTPRCVNHCELTIADVQVQYWTYAFGAYSQFRNHPCNEQPPYGNSARFLR